jgi:hypothetical protein
MTWIKHFRFKARSLWTLFGMLLYRVSKLRWLWQWPRENGIWNIFRLFSINQSRVHFRLFRWSIIIFFPDCPSLITRFKAYDNQLFCSNTIAMPHTFKHYYDRCINCVSFSIYQPKKCMCREHWLTTFILSRASLMSPGQFC